MNQIIIQIILTIFIVLAIFKILHHHNSASSKALSKIFFIIFLVFGLVMIFNPEITNDIAHLVGINRGAYLMLYVLVIFFIFDKVNDFYKEQHQKERFAKLVRKIALQDSNKKK